MSVKRLLYFWLTFAMVADEVVNYFQLVEKGSPEIKPNRIEACQSKYNAPSNRGSYDDFARRFFLKTAVVSLEREVSKKFSAVVIVYNHGAMYARSIMISTLLGTGDNAVTDTKGGSFTDKSVVNLLY